MEAKRGARLGGGVRFGVVWFCRPCPTQFCPVFTGALIAKRAEPLRRMSLQDCGTGADDFSALAPGVARGTDGAQATLGRGPIWRLWQGTLTGSLARAIHVEDDPPASLSIP